jgi:hypothetical protein
MRWTVACLVVLAACDLFGPEVLFVNRRPMVPVPNVYAEWYAATERCLVVSGDFGAVRWFLADSVIMGSTAQAGVLRFPNEITMFARVAQAEWAVRHEAAHHILQRGDDLHGEYGRVPCEHG